MKLKTVILTLCILCLTVGIVSAHGHHEKTIKDHNKHGQKYDYNKNHKESNRDDAQQEEPEDSVTSGNTGDTTTPTDESTVSEDAENTENPTVSDNPSSDEDYNDQSGFGDQPYVNLKNNPSAKDPTFAEVVAFIKSDQTDKIPYSSSYQCDQSARDVHNNAEAAGIRTAYVSIQLSNPNDLQFCDAFQTTDKGLIYVDCTGDPGGPETSNCDCTVKNVAVGVKYHPESLYPPYDRDYTQGTIESFKLYW